jgi:type I restriction enzyme S subunit
MEMLDIEVFEGGFKETELGPLPEEWEVVRLGEVFDVKQGKQLSSKESKEGKTLRPFLRTSNVLWNKIDISSISYMPFSDEEFETLKLRRGDILVCEGGDVGRTSVWEGQLEECAYQNHLHRLRPKENNIVNYFFSYWMEYAICLRGLYVNSANRTTIPNLSAQRLKSFLIPLPPLEEQKAIAGILSTVQSAIEKTEKVINALKNLKKSMMKHLFTYGPVAEEEAEDVELKETEIGLIPKHWEVVRLGEVAKFKIGRTPPRNIKEYWEDGKYFWVSIADMRNAYIYKTNEKVSEKAYKEIFKGNIVPAGTLLMSFKLTIGRTAFFMVDGFHNEAIVSIYPKEQVLKEFLFFCLPTIDYSEFQDRAIKGNTLNISKIEKIPLPLPPLEEQQKIAQILQSIDQRIEKEEKYKNALQNLFKSLLHNLMTGKIRVRVKSHGED